MRVAVVGRGIGGVDAESDDPTLRSTPRSAPTCIAELVELANDVIGREPLARHVVKEFVPIDPAAYRNRAKLLR